MIPGTERQTMGAINYVIGDATQPQGDGRKIIAHICNDLGAWGAGFVLALSRRYPMAEREYRLWAGGNYANPFTLGAVQFVDVGDGITIANMVAQRGVTWAGDVPPIRYGALQEALELVSWHAQEHGASVHMPRIGTGLAGGKWDRIELRIVEAFIDHGVAVTVYDLA